MENYNIVRAEVKSILESIYGTVRDDGTWFNLRCPFCGDSEKSDNIHFGFKFPDTYAEDNTYIMNCFQPKCTEARGTPSVKHLAHMGLEKVQGLVHLIETSLKNQGKGYKWIYKDFEFSATPMESFNDYIKPYKAKIDYWYRRTNYPIQSFDDLNKFRIILDIDKFRNSYKIDTPGFNDKNRISFLNNGGSQVSTRAILSNEEIKKYNMIKQKKWTIRQVEHTPYILKRGILDGTQPIYVYIVEGVFDAVNVFNHISKEANCVVVNTNSIISLKKSMSYVLSLYNVNTNFILVADADIIEDELQPSTKRKQTKIEIALCKYGFYIPEIKVIWNNKAKDFGDISEEWELYSMTKVLRK